MALWVVPRRDCSPLLEESDALLHQKPNLSIVPCLPEFCSVPTVLALLAIRKPRPLPPADEKRVVAISSSVLFMCLSHSRSPLHAVGLDVEARWEQEMP